MEFGEQMLIVVAVLGLFGFVVLELRRRGRVNIGFGGQSRVRRLEVIERLPLTASHSLHLVRIADRQLLIGVSPAGCSLIDQAPGTSIPDKVLPSNDLR